MLCMWAEIRNGKWKQCPGNEWRKVRGLHLTNQDDKRPDPGLVLMDADAVKRYNIIGFEELYI